MYRILNTATFFTGLTVALLIAMGVQSNAQTELTGCAKKVNGQLRIQDCDVDNDTGCLPSEYCVSLGGGSGGGGGEDIDLIQSCPSIIGGRGIGGNITSAGGSPTPVIRYSAYFFATPNSSYTSHDAASQSVETAGSIRGLDVRQVSPVLATNSNYTFEIQGGVVPNSGTRPTCTVTGNGSANSCNSPIAQCIDLNPGDTISVKSTPSGTVSPSNNSTYFHSAVFDGCVCCDGNAPDENGDCYAPPQ